MEPGRPVVGVNLKDAGPNLDTRGNNPHVDSGSTKFRLLHLKQNPWNLLREEQHTRAGRNAG